MTPEKQATSIYLTIYKDVGCAARTRRIALFMVEEILKETNIPAYWEAVKEEIKKL